MLFACFSNLRCGVCPPGFSGPRIGQGARTGPPPLSTSIKTARCPSSSTIFLFNPSPIPPLARPLGLIMCLPSPYLSLPPPLVSAQLRTLGDARFEARIFDSLDLPLDLRCS